MRGLGPWFLFPLNRMRAGLTTNSVVVRTAMAEYTRAIQDTQAEGEEYKTRALEAAHENIVRLAAKDETIATQQVRPCWSGAG